MNETDTYQHGGEPEEDMLPKYDFSEGVRGKHATAYHSGYRVMIHKRDGSTEIQELELPPEAILLDPDVRIYFDDARTVNQTLRSLIALLPKEKGLGKIPT